MRIQYENTTPYLQLKIVPCKVASKFVKYDKTLLRESHVIQMQLALIAENSEKPAHMTTRLIRNVLAAWSVLRVVCALAYPS